jgi:hypothetical protein
MVDTQGSAQRRCGLCNNPLSPDADACPHCGNVFRKDEGDWEWRLIPEEAGMKKSKNQK